jgi:hypothetical protein
MQQYMNIIYIKRTEKKSYNIIRTGEGDTPLLISLNFGGFYGYLAYDQLCTRFKLSKRMSKDQIQGIKMGTQATRSNQLSLMGKSCHK